MRAKIRAMLFLISVGMGAQAAVQYWDPSSTPGYQHADGNWSTSAADTNWTSAGIAPRTTWTNGNDAAFAGAGGYSQVTVSDPVTVKEFSVTGNGYTVVLTNGARLTFTNYNTSLSLGSGASGSSNAIIIAGGIGVTSVWEQSAAISKMYIGGVGNMQNAMLVDGAGFSGSAQYISKDYVYLGALGGFYNCLSVVRGGNFTCVGLSLADGCQSNLVTVSGGPGVLTSLSPGSLKFGSANAGVGTTNNAMLVDGQGVDGSAIVTNGGIITICTQPGDSRNGITVLNGGRLSSGNITVGNVSTGASNYLVVDNGFYTNSGNFLVGAGLGAKFNSIVITNGGKFLTGGGTVSAIGMAGSLSNSMAVIGGAGGVSMVNAISHAINLLGSNSTLLVDGQGVADSAIVTNAGMTVGAAAAQNQNGVTIRNGGRIFTGGAAVIGTLGSGNYVRVEGGAVTSLWNAGNSTVTVGSGATAQNNTLAIDGKGITGAAAVTNTAALIVGSSSSYNSLLITNGGLLALNSTLNISIDGTSNRLDIVGNASAKSVLNAGNFAITVGNNNGTNNMLLVDGQGTVGAAVITNSAALSFGASTNGTRGNIIRFANGGVGYISSATIAAPVSGLGASVNCPAYDNVFEILDGARVYSAGMVAVAYSQKANTHPFARNRLLVRGSESFLALNGSALMVGGDVTGGAGISNNECRIDAGLVTNVGAVQIAYNISADPVINGNSLIITNGGRLYSSAASIVSTTTPSTGNVITVTGAGSIWNLGTQSLTIGYATTSSSNLLVIDQGGLVDSIATLSVLTNNAVKLQGGTLGVTTWTLDNGLLFTVGDGTQAATLKSLAGGTLSFNKGLLITSNAVLAGVGTVSGGATGVILTNGASLAPGSSGIGTLTIGGSNLTWNAGATYIVGISNFAGNAGVAYDTLNVSSQLTLVANAGSSSLVIRVSSMGTLAANFSANASYNLLVASNAVLTGFDPTKFTVNTNDFLNPSAGTWGVMSLNNGLYVTYSPSAETSLAYTWAAPTNGNWTVGGNWIGGLSPPAISPGMQLTFGGALGAPYYAINDNAGNFQLNRLILTNANSAATDVLAGNPMQFWNADAALEQWGSGSFIISNLVNTVTGLVFRGTGAGSLTIASNITAAGSLVMQGAGTVFMNGSNNYLGPLLVNAPGGTLQVNNLNALSTNSLVVSNGTLRIPTGLATIGNSAGYRSALVSGSGSLWTNGSALTIGSNAQVTVDAGGTLSIGGALIVSNMGPAANGLIVTNGGMLFSTAASFVGNASSNNSMLVAGGGALWNGGAVALTVGNSATATNNLLRLDGQGAPGGAVVTNLSTLTVGAIAGADRNGLIVGNGGRIFTAGAAVIGTAGSGNYVRVQGPAGSLWNAGNAAVTVGSGAGARNNALVIDGNGVDGGSVVTNTGTLNTFIIGSAAAANSVIITNGGRLFTGGAATIGNAGSTGNYVRVEGGAVTSLWNAGNQTLTVGSGANAIFNTLTIDGKGVLGSAVVTNASKLFVNYNAQSGGGPNLVLVTNQGILSVGTLCVGYNTADSLYSSSNNVLEIAQGGQVFASNNIAIGGALNEIYKGHHSNNRLVVRDANSVLDMRNSSLTIAFLNSGSGVYTSGFNQVLCDGGLITNMGATTVGCTVGSNDVSGFNGITVTNGGRIYSRGAIQVAVNYQSNDWITITGTNSIWDAGGSNLTVGTSIVGNSDNAVLINNSGTLDAIGTLTLAGALNYVNLRGGTLGVANTTYTNGMFAAGDGVQAATLKALGGTLSFANGLQIKSNATLTGVGTVSGGTVGVSITNGATIAPGLPGGGVGTLTIGGSNLVWNRGGVYRCEITNLNIGAGSGWDILNVSSQLVFAGGTPKYVIRLDSKGAAAGGFDPALNYNLKILSYSGMTGYDTNQITLDVSAFSTDPVSTWRLTNFNNAIYLAYDGTAPVGDAGLVWNVPSNGNWNVGGNWTGGAAPSANGDPTNVLNFWDNGTRYSSTNNLAGAFQLNKLVLANVSGITNAICGSNLAFTVNAATAPRLEYQSGGGGFVISNALSLGAGMIFGGAGGGTLVLASNVTGGQPLIKQGPWTLALAGSNTFANPVVVTNASAGIIRLDNNKALGTNSVTVSDGGRLLSGVACIFADNNQSDRQGLVTDAGSVWTNSSSLVIGKTSGSRNNAITVRDGGQLTVGTYLSVGVSGAMNNTLTVAAGGSVKPAGMFCVGGDVNTAAAGAATNNTAIVTDGGQLNLGVLYVGYAMSRNNSLIITNGGQVSYSAASCIGKSPGTGSGSVSNICVVSGAGSVLSNNNGGVFSIADYSSIGNVLRIENGGVGMFAPSAVNMGSYDSSNNLFEIRNGGRFVGFLNMCNSSAGRNNYNEFRLTGTGSVMNGIGVPSSISTAGPNDFNTAWIADGAVASNCSWTVVGSSVTDRSTRNQLIVTNGGCVIADVGTSYVASGLLASNNAIVVTGTNLDTGAASLWNSSGKDLYVSSAITNIGNSIIIRDGGVMTNVGTLQLASAAGSSNNSLTVDGGVLQATTVTCNNGLPNWVMLNGACSVTVSNMVLTNAGQNVIFNGGTLNIKHALVSNGLAQVLGDGTQLAALSVQQGGTNIFANGLLINTNATLTGIGTVIGGAVGVSLTNGATIAPGLTGVGTLTIGGSNLTWNAGGTCIIGITNFVGGAGVGYDTINVSSQLALVADVGSSSLVIRISSMGALAANFVTNISYNLLVASYATLTGFEPTKFTVNTDDFQNTVDGTWGVASFDNKLYVTYRPLSDAGSTYTWAAPSNGNWTVGGNWIGGLPPAGIPEMQLTFGGGASEPAYAATNDNAGNFQLNRLVLTNANASATCVLAGNPMQFWNADAAIEQAGSGSFIVTNALSATVDLHLSGAGSGAVMLTNLTVAGALTKQGASTVVLTGTNSFIGALVVDGVGGTLRINNLNALSTNSVVVSNGTMVLNVGACTFNNPLPAPVRTLTMSGGIVTNASPLTIGSNALVTVTGTGRLIANTLSIQAAPSVTTNLCITDGGYVGFLSQPTLFGANNVIYVGGNPARPSVFSGGGTIYFQSAAGQSNNLLLIDQGGIVTNFTSSHLGSGAGANGNRMIITNGGKLFSTVTFAVGDPGSSNNSILVTAGPAGPGMWNAGGGTLSLGNGGAGNSIVVDQGVVTNAVLSIGGAAGGTNNLFMITNGGAVYLSAGSFVGQIESSNTAIIAGGSGCTSLLSGPIWGVGAGTASGNKLIIDGRGAPGSALLTNAILLSIGYGSGSGNLLLVTNGGWVFSSVAPDIGHTAGAANNRIIVTGDQSLWNMGGGSLAIGFIASVTNNSLMIDQGALVTNGGPINVGNFASDAGNALLITNASRLFSAGACTIGATAGATGNTAIVTGGSTWSLGNSTLAVGIAGSTNNALTITQGGIVDKIGTLTLAGALNYVNLRGGTLGVANTTYTNGLFTAGDGIQAATLKSLAGGTLTFTNGLLMTNNATLTGAGTVSGGATGVILTNGASLAPGLSGIGTLTIGGSNLTWNAGATYVCEIANFVGGAGVGYDMLNVSSQLALVADVGSSSLVIRVSSMGTQASNFSANASYNLLVASNAVITGFEPTKFTVNTDDFLNTMDGAWGVASFDNKLYVTYRPLSDAGSTYTWAAPANGSWTIGGNWIGGMPPSASSPGMQLNFGGGASESAYSATNDNAGNFQLNRLVLTNANASATCVLAGNPMQFWNADAAIEQVGSGSFIVSNSLNTVTDLAFRGTGAGSITIASNITAAGSLIIQGAGTVFMNGSNNYFGPLLVNAPGGTLQVNNLNALPTNSLVVSNGTLRVPSVLATFGNGIGYRSALVSGSSSLWTNGVALTIGTNAQVTVDAGGKLAINGALTLANMGTVANGLIVTNGGRITTSGEFIVGTGNTSNRALIAAGGQVYSLSNVRVGNNAGGHQNTLVVRGDNALLDVNAQALCVGYHASVSLYSNLMIIADNAIVTNCSLNVGGGAYNNNNSLLVTNGGKLFSKGVVTYIGSTGSSNSVAVVGGTSASLWNNGGQQLTLGLANGSRNNSLVIDGAGAGAMVTNVTTFQIGGTGAGMCNSLIVTNGGILVYGSAALDNNGLGYDNSNNTFAIAMGGKVYARGATSYVGEYGPASSNLMSIRDPGSLFDGGGGSITIGAYNYGAMGNILIIDNDGQVTNCSVNVGGRLGATSYNPLWNRMVITNGGKLFGVAGANNTIGGNVGGSYNSAAVNSNSLWNVAGGALIVGQGTNNSLSISDGGLVTNAASVYVGYLSPSAVFNRLVITNGGKLYSKNVCGIGYPDTGAPAYGQSSNTASVTGPNSVWDLGGASLTVGYVVAAGAATGNVLTIDQGGLVDNIGTLTVGTNNNAVKLYGGTLGLASAIYSNSLFTVGDGLQAATLKTLGGTVNFMSGLRITNNAVLTGIGTVSGGGAGVTLTNGATIAPGLPGGGVGTLTIGGSNLIWRAGATYVCEIIDMKLGPGLGWDLLNVSSQLVLNGTGLGIKITGTPVNFDAGKDYNLRILNYGTQAGYSLTTFTLDATTFTPASSWIVTNTGSAIWLVYRGGAAPSGASLTWSVPNSGSWSVNGNWTGGTAPGAGGNATNIMVFGDNGTAYNSTNDYPGLFANNQLQLSSASSATNYIKGGALLFANNGEIGARIDYLSGNSGAFTISNNVLMANDTEFGGNAFGGTVVMAGNVTNMGTLTKKGAWTLALAGNNDLRGDLLIDSPDGTLRLDSTAVIPQTPGLGNAPNLIVSNGTLYINHGGQNCSLLMNTPNRSVLVTGSGSVWSNTIGGSSYLYLADGITNAAVTITAGGKLFTPAQLYVSQNGGSFNSLIITNGGQVTCGGSGVISDSNNQVVITGSGSFWKPGAAVSITGTNNLLQLDNGGLLNNTVNMGGVNNTFVVSNGLISSSAILVNGVGSRATLTGSNTLALLVASSYIGNGAGLAGNMVTVNGGAVATGVSWYVGAAIGSRNGLIVTNGGKMFIAGLNVGNNASSNFVIVTGPNSLLNGNTAIGYVGSGPAGVSNTVTVDDRAIVTNISWQLNAVATSRWSQVAVANGGQMSAGAAASYVSYAAFGTNNTIVVTGSNSVTGNQSVWNSQGQNLIVANGGTNAGNGVVIQDGGMMTNVGNFNLAAAAAAGSSNNYLTVDGGILQASTLTCSNSLPNWVTLNGACLVTVSNLVLTNAGQIVTFKGGTLNLVSATISSGQAQVVGDGTQSAVLNLLPGGTNSFTDGLVITNQATLSGSGLIAASSAVYGTLSPGAGIGAITSRGDFTLKPSASTTIEMGAYTTPGAGWDLLTVASGALNLGGSLKVLLNGGFAPAITQSYLVMTNLVPASVSGTFAADTAAAYTNASMSGTPAGRFKVAVGTQGVTLHSYAAWKPAGAMIFIW